MTQNVSTLFFTVLVSMKPSSSRYCGGCPPNQTVVSVDIVGDQTVASWDIVGVAPRPTVVSCDIVDAPQDQIMGTLGFQH